MADTDSPSPYGIDFIPFLGTHRFNHLRIIHFYASCISVQDGISHRISIVDGFGSYLWCAVLYRHTDKDTDV